MSTLSNACDYRGASMGRADSIQEPDAPIKFKLQKMRMNGYGCYDEGGAYWGRGAPMWHAFGDGPEYINEMFVRAIDRTKAKAAILAKFKNAKFYK